MSDDDLFKAAAAPPGLRSVSRSLEMLGMDVLESDESPSKLLNSACCRGVTEPGKEDLNG